MYNNTIKERNDYEKNNIYTIFCRDFFIGCGNDKKVKSKGELECDRLVEIQEEAWLNMVKETKSKNWSKESYPSIKNWDLKQRAARSICVDRNGNMYEGIVVLNNRMREFGKAGGFKHNYNE